MIADKNSRYYAVSRQCQLYQPSAYDLLTTDTFRQIWRNQLLGESMLLEKDSDFHHFTSIIIYPEENIHIGEACTAYMDMLVQNDGRFLSVSYEDFIEACRAFVPNERFGMWVDYLEGRYIL